MGQTYRIAVNRGETRTHHLTPISAGGNRLTFLISLHRDL
jgi:hypothetical protein